MDKISLCLYMLYFWACSVYAVLAPFFPQYAYEKGLNEKDVGYIFSLYAFVAFLLSPINGRIMNSIGRKNVLLIGGITESIGMFMFTIVIEFEGIEFLVLSIVARVLMGAGSSALLVTCFAVISNLFPDHVEDKIGIMETLGGIGLMAGPFIGGFIYSLGGYQVVMISYTLLFLVLTLFTYLVLPKDNPEELKNQEKVGYCQILSIPKIDLALIVVVFGMAGPAFLEPVLSKYLIEELNLGSTEIGLIFALPTLGYTIAMKILSWIPKSFDRRHILFFGVFIEGLSFLMVGPWSIIYNSNIYFTSFSLVFLGFGSAWAYIPSLPYLIDISSQKWPNANKELLSNTLSTIMGTTHYFGETVGPIVGGLSCYTFGMADGFAFFGLLALGYFFVCGLVIGEFWSWLRCDWRVHSEKNERLLV